MKFPPLPLNEVRQCLQVYQMTIPASYQDYNDHMNIRWYLVIYDDAGLPLYDALGLTPELLKVNGNTTFDLEQHLHYLQEVRVGDTITVYARVVGRSAKRFHYLMFMVNETRGTLASVFECVNTFVDLATRKTTPYPAHIAERIDHFLAEHRALAWEAPISGSMGA